MKKKLNNKVTERQLINFVEELSWLVEKYDKNVFSELYNYIQEKQNQQSSKGGLLAKSKGVAYSREYLVGVLPSLFQDMELFPSRDDILDFAETVLMLKPSRAARRSRTEYIGWIVCEVAISEDNRLDYLVDAFEKLLHNEKRLKEVKDSRKEPNFSWNDTISKLKEIK